MKPKLFFILLLLATTPMYTQVNYEPAVRKNILAQRMNEVRYCNQFTGSTAGAKLLACVNDLPSAGGTADATGLATGTISTDILGSVTKKVRILLGASYTVTVSQTIRDGQIIEGPGPINRWRSAVGCPATLNYTGTGQLFNVAPGASTGRDSIYFRNICMDGSGASGSVDGVRLNGSAASAYIEGVRFENVGIYNFPRYQVYATGTVFDVQFNDVTIHNSGRAADNLIQYEGSAASKWMFYNPWLAQYTAGKWAIFGGATAALPSNAMANVVLVGGTVTGQDSTPGNSNGANGVWVNGGLYIYGTDFNASEADQPRSIAIRYTGNNSALIWPSACGHWGTCVELGNSGNEVSGTARTTDPSIGAIIMGSIGFNNNCVTPIICSDVNIVTNASRKGTYINLGGNYAMSGDFGQANSLPFIQNNASVQDDVFNLEWTSTTGYPRIGPLNLDIANTRLGVNVDPALRFHVRTGNNDGIRLDNSANSNRIGCQMLNIASQGQLTCYDSSEVNKVVINGDATSAFSTTGAASVDASAIITLTSTTKGFLPPVMTSAQRDAIGTPTAGLVIYNSTTGSLNYYNGAWVSLTGVSGTATVRDAGGAADCNLVFTAGLLTSTTC